MQLNDQINSVLNRYDAFKKGDFSFASNPIPAELGASGSGPVSLIDLEESTPSTQSNGGGGIDELVGLFGSGASIQPTSQPPYAAPPPINPSTKPTAAPVHAASPTRQPTPGSIMLPGTPEPPRNAGQLQGPNYFGAAAPARPAQQKDPFADLAGLF